MTRTSQRVKRVGPAETGRDSRLTRTRPSRTRSFPCPDDLWKEVETFAQERGLGAPAAAARLLLSSGLRVERRLREVEAARDWQIAQAWAEVQAVAAGDRAFGSWTEIDRAVERARARIRAREATGKRIATGP